MRFVLGLLLSSFIFSVSTNAQGVKFVKSNSWKDVLAKAKKERKLVFVDCYATWCVPCKQMNDQVFPKKEVGDFLNDKFVAIKIQMDRTDRDDASIKRWYEDVTLIGQKYHVEGYPTVLFIDGEGRLVKNIVGFLKAADLIAEAKKSIEISEAYDELIKRFQTGQMDIAQKKVLIDKAREFQDMQIIHLVSEDIISRIPSNEVLTKDNLIFIGDNLCSSSKYFKMFLNEPEKINAVVSKNFAENQIMALIHREEIDPFDNKEQPDWNEIEKRVVAKYGALGQERIYGNKMVYYHSVQDWNNYGKFYKLYFDIAVPKERSFIHINNMSWPVFEHVTDSSVLETALKTMEYNIDKFDRYDPNALDTYANLLYKANKLYKIRKKEDAILWQELASRLSNRQKNFDETLDKMKNDTLKW